MSIQNDFLTFAAGAGANVLPQTSYAALTQILANGFSAGVAPSAQVNKVLRQANIMACVLAQFIVDQSQQPAVDDGTIGTLEANLIGAINSLIAPKTRGSAGKVAAYFTPVLNALNTRSLTFTPASNGVVFAIQTVNLSSAQPTAVYVTAVNVTPGGTPDADTLQAVGGTNVITFPVTAGTTYTAAGGLTLTSGTSAPLSQHLAYIFVPSN